MSDVMSREGFGDVLRSWRSRRNRSQLALASEAGVSQRHISFLETGRSRPSREMVVHLGLVLDVPLRERNTMLVAAGFAPVYPERGLDDPDLAGIRRSLELMLDAHNPFPAYIVDRCWNLVLANEAATRLILGLPDAAQGLATNLADLVFHPDGLRAITRNWAEAAAALLLRLEREVDSSPGDVELAELLARIRAYPGVPDERGLAEVPSGQQLVVPLEVDLDGRRLAFFTTIATLSGPFDITLEELRLETLLPADAHTERVLRELTGDSAGGTTNGQPT